VIRNRPVETAVTRQSEVVFLGEARPGGIAAVGNAAEGIFDGQGVEGSRIVVACPFFEVGMARMSGIGDHFEQFVEARDAAAILGPFRSPSM
jgi:hypothetical protein